MKGIKVIILLLLAVSCTPQKKLQRLLDKHPELTKKDTLTIRDTITTETISHDTLLNWTNLYDTTYIEKDRLRIKVVRVNDSIYIKGECIGDTIYYEKIVPVDKIIYKKSEKSLNLWLIFVGVLLVIAIIRWLFRG
jgi:hypothetical protein